MTFYASALKVSRKFLEIFLSQVLLLIDMTVTWHGNIGLKWFFMTQQHSTNQYGSLG